MAEPSPALPRPRPAAAAARRLTRAGALLGLLGLISAVLVVLRLLETWRVEPDAAAHRVSILGAHLSYPTANAAAVLLLVQAALGLAVLGLSLRAGLRELLGSRRLNAWLRTQVAFTLGDAAVIEDDRPTAFCAGLLRPRIYVSTGALSALDKQALDAVLEHEREHRRRQDPLRLAVGRVMVHALFFVPGRGALSTRHESLTELSADERAVQASAYGGRALARAMLTFSEDHSAAPGVGIDPARADALLGRRPDWQFPTVVCLGAGLVLAVLILLGVLVGRVANGASTLDLPFLSAQPCVLVLALIPAGLGWLAWRASRRRSGQ
jgi:hypothetical protein